MAFDSRKVILAAVPAALENDYPAKPKKRRQLLPAKRALLLGAGLAAAGRIAVGSRGRDAMANLQDRLADFEDRFLADDEPEEEDFADEDYDEDFDEDFDEDEGPVDEEPLDGEPVDEEEPLDADEEPVEDDEEPVRIGVKRWGAWG